MFYDDGGETLDQVAWRDGRCPIPGNVEDQVGQGSEQPGLVVDVPAHCAFKGPFQVKLFCDSKINTQSMYHLLCHR